MAKKSNGAGRLVQMTEDQFIESIIEKLRTASNETLHEVMDVLERTPTPMDGIFGGSGKKKRAGLKPTIVFQDLTEVTVGMWKNGRPPSRESLERRYRCEHLPQHPKFQDTPLTAQEVDELAEGIAPDALTRLCEKCLYTLKDGHHTFSQEAFDKHWMVDKN